MTRPRRWSRAWWELNEVMIGTWAIVAAGVAFSLAPVFV